jgi:hypothetical protein
VVKLAKALSGLSVAALMFVAVDANAGSVLSEGFNGPGIPAGWLLSPAVSVNSPINWQKPDDIGGPGGEFPAQSGAPDSYLFNSFNSTPTSPNVIDDFLITPLLTINNGTVISFFIKGDPNQESQFPDRLRVLLSPTGGSTPASFTRVIADINPTYSATGFPTDWTLESFVVTGLTGFVSTRIAFEYLINNTNTEGDLIGLDTVNVTVTVPEPDSLALAAVGLVALGLSLRKSRKQRVLA